MNRPILACARLGLVVAALALSAGAFSAVASSDMPDGAADTTERHMNGETREKPDSVSRLEAAYGGPSEGGFGSAVFHETLQDTDDLTQAALSTYRTFVGKLWGLSSVSCGFRGRSHSIGVASIGA